MEEQTKRNLTFQCDRVVPLMQVDEEEDKEFNLDDCGLEHRGKKKKSKASKIIKSKLNSELVNEEFGDDFNLQDIDTHISNEEFVRLSILRAKKLFRKEAGRADTKRANLGDIKSTRVSIPAIL